MFRMNCETFEEISGLRLPKQLTEKLSWTIITRGQTRKTIIDFHEEFEHAQNEW